MRPFVGIDFGTTVTVAAATVPRRRTAGPDGSRRQSPQVVAVGSMRAIRATEHSAPDPTTRCVKSTLGDLDRRVSSAQGGQVRPEEVSALLLAQVAADAQQALGVPLADVVLTVPASFDFLARQALLDAGVIAGFRVRDVLTEPAAAVLAYHAQLIRDRSVLVFDLGGGGFDATLLHVGEDSIEVQATVGDRRLGGWDWDNQLMRLLQDRVTAAGGPDLLAEDDTEDLLRSRAQGAKHRLSVVQRTEVVLRYGGRAWRVPVTRADFESATEPELARTRALVELLLRSTPRAGIDRVLLVGGPTRMPAVSRMLRPLGVPLDRSVVPSHAVALGAARHDRTVRIRDVAPYGLGVLARSARTGSLRNVPVLPAGIPLPAVRSAILTTGEDGPGQLIIDVTVGDGTDAAAVRTVHRETVVLGRREPGMRVELRCSYDGVDAPQVDLRDATTGRALGSFQVRSRTGMNDADVGAATRRVARLRCQ